MDNFKQFLELFGLLRKDQKIHWQDPRQYQNNRATEDRSPWNCPRTKEDSIHQVI